MVNIARFGKAVVLVALVALAAASVSACNTARGIGKDVEATGETIQGGATRNQQQR